MYAKKGTSTSKLQRSGTPNLLYLLDYCPIILSPVVFKLELHEYA